ncbi:hypothetical protein D3C76_1528000 [compost metagenome]
MGIWMFMGCGFQPKNTTGLLFFTARFTAVSMAASLDSISLKSPRPNWLVSIIFRIAVLAPEPDSIP